MFGGGTFCYQIWIGSNTPRIEAMARSNKSSRLTYPKCSLYFILALPGQICYMNYSRFNLFVFLLRRPRVRDVALQPFPVGTAE